MKMNFELLPNEIFIEYFEYLNGPDIFYSFDRLNYRFNKLIRNTPLHVDFQQFTKEKFKQFFRIMLSNPEIEHNIISLTLSNEGTRGQIKNFLLYFSLDDFINLRSLSLINLKKDDADLLLHMLPFLSNLHYFSYTGLHHTTWEMILKVSESKLRILSIPELDYYSTHFIERMSITSLAISHSYLYELSELFKHVSMLKYLKIEHFENNPIMDTSSKVSTENIAYLKQLTIDYAEANFETLELLLKHTPNLTSFTINSPDEIDMIDANRWQHLIESSLPHLHVFNFYFCCMCKYPYDDKLDFVEEFQTNFWTQQHHWYTNYEVTFYFITIYTMPYVWNQYSLMSTTYRYDHSNEFDNVTNLTLSRQKIKDTSPYYFKNVHTLTLINEINIKGKLDRYKLKIEQIKFLNKIVNVSNIKHLEIRKTCNMLSSSILLKILKELPYVSILGIDKRILLSFIRNHELREYFYRNINTLYIPFNSTNDSIKSSEVNLICKKFSNLEELHCHITKLDHLLSILKECSKLSLINIIDISKDIYSWYEKNESKLKVYIDFILIDGQDEDLLNNTDTD